MIVLSAAAVVWAMTASAVMQDRFPDGPGKTELLKVCSGCHEPDNVFTFPQSAPEWTNTLQNMVERGTEASDAEWKAIETYIDKYIALIPVNMASRDELVKTMDVTPAVADAVITYRKDKPFKTADDVKKVPGLAAANVDTRKDRFVF